MNNPRWTSYTVASMATAQPTPISTPFAVTAASVSGLCYALAQPSWGAWPLAALCLIPLLWSFVGRSTLGRAGLGWLAGSVATGMATVVPATVGTTAFFGLSLWQGALVAVTVGQLFGAGSFALAAVLAGDPSRRGPLASALRVGAAWVGAELLRSTLFSGLPWLLLAHSLAGVPALIQSASLGGSLLVSLWLAALNAALLLLVLGPSRRAALTLCGGIAAAVTASFLLADVPPTGESRPGSVARAAPEAAPGTSAARILLVQGNLPNAWRGDLGRIRDALTRLVDLSESAGPIDLAVWPENAVSFLLPMNESLVQDATRRLGDSPRHLLLGTPRMDDSRPPRLYNAAALFGPDRHVIAYHDKVHRLPFAEYIPRPFAALGLRGGHMQAGDRPKVLSAGSLRVGPLICYEVIFAELARAQAQAGAGVLINLSNDAWFGSTGAIEQHFASAVFRAVETRRPVLRATNTGISAAIDAWGRVVSELPPNQPAALVVDVVPGSGLTTYVRTGEVVAGAALALSGLLSLLDWVTSSRQRSRRR